MTKKLEQLLNLPNNEEDHIGPKDAPTQLPQPIDLQEKLEEFDKISAALPRVKGLGDMADGELDALAAKAEQAYDDLMDLGMNVEVRYGARMFEVAANMMNAAIQAKSAKIDKKLKMVELQLKKLAIDKKHSDAEQTIEAQGYVITDRNSLLEKLKNMK
ncbi:MAG: hypothetical protein EBX47_08005 [Synechococcaceae bacterium WB8_1B_057]|nr:hypothetical protein [Synechococcaceae bacterium WB6_1A_059]NDG79359.1 hypothetical protein [Synechococcaceae bacterium WB8_1B_057]